MAESKFEKNSQNFINDMKSKVRGNMHNVLNAYQARLEEKLDTPPARTGRVYKFLAGIRRHVASDAGEPPAPLTRELIDSLEKEELEFSKYRWSGIVYTDKEYALALEFGRTSYNPMSPRPAWVPVFNEYRKGYGNLATQGFRRR